MTTDLAHRQPPIGGETTQSKPSLAPDGACGCSVQRSCSALGSSIVDVREEKLGLFDFDGFDDDIKAFDAKHKYGVVTENFVMLQLIRSINRLTSELANRNNRSDNSKDAEDDVEN